MNKKPYVRPVLVHESFELAEHIAACDIQLSTNSPEGCTVSKEVPGFPGLKNIFVDPTKCDKPGDPNSDIYCYTGFSGAPYKLINS